MSYNPDYVDTSGLTKQPTAPLVHGRNVYNFWSSSLCRSVTVLAQDYESAKTAFSTRYPGSSWRLTSWRNATKRDLRPGFTTLVAGPAT